STRRQSSTLQNVFFLGLKHRLQAAERLDRPLLQLGKHFQLDRRRWVDARQTLFCSPAFERLTGVASRSPAGRNGRWKRRCPPFEKGASEMLAPLFTSQGRPYAVAQQPAHFASHSRSDAVGIPGDATDQERRSFAADPERLVQDVLSIKQMKCARTEDRP